MNEIKRIYRVMANGIAYFGYNDNGERYPIYNALDLSNLERPFIIVNGIDTTNPTYEYVM